MGSDFLKGLGVGLLAPTAIGYISGFLGGLGGIEAYLFYIYLVIGIVCLFMGFRD